MTSPHDEVAPVRLTYAVFSDELSAQWAVEELVEAGFLPHTIRVLVRDANYGEPDVQPLGVEAESQASLGLVTGTTVGAIAGTGLALVSPWAFLGAGVPWVADAALVGACIGSVVGIIGGMEMCRHVIETRSRRFAPAAFLVGVRTRGPETGRARVALAAVGAPVVFVQTPRKAHMDFYNPRLGEAARSLGLLTTQAHQT